MEVWDVVAGERTDLADLLDTLTPEQWDSATLCTGWRVRDVTAHLIEGATIPAGKLMVTVLKYGFRINTMLEREACKLGASPTDELAREFRASIGSHNLPPGVKPTNVAADVLIHQQDIRRGLGEPREIPADHLRLVADSISVMNVGFPAKKRIAGLRLRATDIDWSHGTVGDPEVAGPAEALIMAMGGRPAALTELTGEGVATLTPRIAG